MRHVDRELIETTITGALMGMTITLMMQLLDFGRKIGSETPELDINFLLIGGVIGALIGGITELTGIGKSNTTK